MKTFKEMEDQFYREVRGELLEGLAQCTVGNRRKFRLIHAPFHPEWDIEMVVGEMSKAQLPWAMQQVQWAIDKRSP